jgi:hypothetical protein
VRQRHLERRWRAAGLVVLCDSGATAIQTLLFSCTEPIYNASIILIYVTCHLFSGILYIYVNPRFTLGATYYVRRLIWHRSNVALYYYSVVSKCIKFGARKVRRLTHVCHFFLLNILQRQRKKSLAVHYKGFSRPIWRAKPNLNLNLNAQSLNFTERTNFDERQWDLTFKRKQQLELSLYK